MDCKIEKATIEDIDSIHKLIYDRCLWFSKKGVKGWNIEFYPNKYDKNYFIEQMKVNKLLVARLDNKVCGSMLLKEEDKDYWKNDDSAYYIHHLATDINQKGIGKKLIDYAKEQCKINSKEYLRLDCYKESLFLNKYYQNLGFNNVSSGTQGNYNYNLWEMKIYMNIKEVIENRRSIRNFKNQDIPNQLVEDILNCGRLAPSSKNRQPWYFVIVKEETKDRIANMMIDYTINNHDVIERKKSEYGISVNPTANVIKQAPILVLIFREKNDNRIIGDNLSIGACVENMCLRATELGIGSLWIRDTVYVAKDIAKMLNHESMELNCALALGYANQIPKMRPRKDLKDILEWYK